MKKTGFLISLSVIILALSCQKIEHLPPVPFVRFISFEVFDTVDILGNDQKSGRLKFYFEDGDGDIGMNPPAGEQADTNNLILELYRKKDGIMERVEKPAPPDSILDPLMPSSYRIPYMEAEGQNKILKGTISVTFLYLSYTSADTIRYDFWIKDRAFNESNKASTSEIVISQNNIY